MPRVDSERLEQLPTGRTNASGEDFHWHLLCSKNTGESHLESSQCLRITLGIFSKFLRIVITHAEKASIVCDDLFQILLQEKAWAAGASEFRNDR